MTQTSTARQILSDSEVGLLPYLRHQLQTEEFSRFEAQLIFQAHESLTGVKQGKHKAELQTALSISLQFLMILRNEISPEDATILALELQEMLETCLAEWSQRSPLLRSPISEISGSFDSLEQVRYHGGYLPGFSLTLKFALVYSSDSTGVKTSTAQSKSKTKLYSPGERTPESGQYELTDSNGESTGVEVTSIQGHPLPPTSEPNQFYKLIDPTKHKKA